MNIRALSRGFRIGDIIYKRGGRFGPRRQEDLQLVYLYRGEAAIDIDGDARTLLAGEATLLLPGHWESFQFSRIRTTRHGWCTADRARPDQAALGELRKLPAVVPFSPVMSVLADIALPLKGATDPGRVSLRSALIEALFHEYLRQAGLQAHPAIPVHPAVRRACGLVEERFEQQVGLADLAHHAGVSSAHLIRLFKEHLSITPARYLWAVRVQAAAELLRDTGLTAAEIAYRTGFANPHHFSRVFRRHHGTPPGAFRQNAWRGAKARREPPSPRGRSA